MALALFDNLPVAACIFPAFPSGLLLVGLVSSAFSCGPFAYDHYFVFQAPLFERIGPYGFADVICLFHPFL